MAVIKLVEFPRGIGNSPAASRWSQFARRSEGTRRLVSLFALWQSTHPTPFNAWVLPFQWSMMPGDSLAWHSTQASELGRESRRDEGQSHLLFLRTTSIYCTKISEARNKRPKVAMITCFARRVMTDASLLRCPTPFQPRLRWDASISSENGRCLLLQRPIQEIGERSPVHTPCRSRT